MNSIVNIERSCSLFLVYFLEFGKTCLLLIICGFIMPFFISKEFSGL